MKEMAKQFFGERENVDVIDRIHEDFDNAAQEFLDKAKEIMSNGTPEMAPEVREKLKTFGFNNSQTIVEIEQAEKAKALAKDVADRVAYYFERYPFNKFITKEQVKDICKKYGLVFGKTKWYIGEIPERNQMEIVSFEVDEKDKVGYPDIMIVASQKEFDMTSIELRDKWELKELPKDPIVLYPVHGGYLIVSKWGKEADIDEAQ